MQENDIDNMIAAAREYCALIDGVKKQPTGDCLGPMPAQLSKLSECVLALGGEPPKEPVVYHGGDLNQRFELYTVIRECLGDRDSYKVEYASGDRGEELEGSLADDFTDIYCELKVGLEFLEQYPDDKETAVQKWLDTFRLHWGQHLFDAIYALNAA